MKLVGTYRSRNDWLYEKYYKNVDYKISRVLHCIGMINLPNHVKLPHRDRVAMLRNSSALNSNR